MRICYILGMKKLGLIILDFLPILIMIELIRLTANDYLLTVVYIILIAICFFIKRERNDFLVFLLGFVALTISESFFISTGVETFVRHTLFGIMPLWLPFLWGYAFVAIKRTLKIIGG